MSDLIDRQAAIDALHMHLMYRMGTDSNKKRLDDWINSLPSAQPEIVRCKDCKHSRGFDPCFYCYEFSEKKSFQKMDFALWRKGGKMNDLINRKGAINAVCTVLYPDADKMNNAKQVLKEMPSAPPEQRWIPCSEKLPEDYDDVLVWFEYFRYGNYNCIYQTYGIGDYSRMSCSWMINHESGWHKLRVIAWQPLPEPYREEGEQDETD